MKKLILLSISLIVGCVFGNTNYKFIPYVSPGIQFGYTFNEGLFYGFQISLGFGIPLDDEHFVIPALSFGIEQSFHNLKLKNKQELVKKYSDLQITYVTKYEFKRGVMECGMPGWQDCPVQPTFFPPVGIGIGKINKEKSSDYRLKVYVWFISNLTYNYELQSKLHSLSLIPVIALPLEKLSYKDG